MTDAPDQPQPMSPLLALGRRWPLALGLTVVCGAAGATAGWLMPTTYTAETRLAVAGVNLSAQATPGFALASQQLAANYARYVINEQESGSFITALGDEASAVEDVSASPIASSNVIRLVVTGSSSEAVSNAAGIVADRLVDQVNNGAPDESPETVLGQFTDLSNQLSAANIAVGAAEGAVSSAIAAELSPEEINLAQADLANKQSAAQVLQVQANALSDKYREIVSSNTTASELRRLDAPVSVTNTEFRSVSRFGVAGAVFGLILALVIAVLRERSRPSRTSPRDGGGDISATRTGGSTAPAGRTP